MSESGDLLTGTAVTVKEAGQYMDIARAAFALGHPSMFRHAAPVFIDLY